MAVAYLFVFCGARFIPNASSIACSCLGSILAVEAAKAPFWKQTKIKRRQPETHFKLFPLSFL